jgi:hypothetical protein
MKTLTKGNILGLIPIADKKTLRPALHGLYFDGETITATDSYKLIRVKHAGMKSEDFPILENVLPRHTIEKPFILNIDDLKKVKFENNKYLPILSTAIFANETEDDISIVSTDLSCNSVTKIKKTNADYPNVDAVIPNDEPKDAVGIDLKHLIPLLKAMQDNGCEQIKIETRGKDKPVIIKGAVFVNHELKMNGDVLGLIMPILFQ